MLSRQDTKKMVMKQVEKPPLVEAAVLIDLETPEMVDGYLTLRTSSMAERDSVN